MRHRRTKGLLLLGGLLSGLAIACVADWADRNFPPPLTYAQPVSREVVDAEGVLLRAFATPEGRWRLGTTAQDVDPLYLRMLIAYEDRRFYRHGGIDYLAFARAAWQFLSSGRVVSGASTLSMQVARLIEPRPGRDLTAKLLQIARAYQLEQRLTKSEIVDLYLTLAPFGGNLEGVRAASLAYFGKEPRRLTVAEAALLVALPQSPERRRPDRFPEVAKLARTRVLERASSAGIVGAEERGPAEISALPRQRLQLPAMAAHVAQAALTKEPNRVRLTTTLRHDVQRGLEQVASAGIERLGPRVSLAMIMADASTGEIVGEIGSADFFDRERSGFVDMTRARRSPGSTLKPFIYGLAFEEGLISQETILEDRPADFSGYRPKNFDLTYQGDVSARQALQLSLNVPAVSLLEAIGPVKLLARFRRAQVVPGLPVGEPPGLAIGLGGVGVTLKDLVQLYAALANGGRPVRLGDGVSEQPAILDAAPLLSAGAVWNIADILGDVIPPAGSPVRPIAYKTGTSYGNRDAWALGYDGRHVLGIWVGRPDNGAVPGLTGYGDAAPLVFQGFAKSGIAITPFGMAPPGSARIAQSQLPTSLRRFSSNENGLVSVSTRERPPHIVYPPEGARVELGVAPDGSPLPLVLKLQGGRAPFRWLANGKPLPELVRTRTSQWLPDGEGYATLTVIDAAGRAASVAVFLD